MSWDEAYADRYDEWSAHMTADIPFYVGLASRSDGPLVELAVGNGRVAVPVAQATGRRVIGIDRSPAMLTQARLKAAEAGVDIELREGDIRDFALAEPAADLLPLPCALASADVDRPPPYLRAGRRRVATLRTVRLERLRLRPPGRKPT